MSAKAKAKVRPVGLKLAPSEHKDSNEIQKHRMLDRYHTSATSAWTEESLIARNARWKDLSEAVFNSAPEGEATIKLMLAKSNKVSKKVKSVVVLLGSAFNLYVIISNWLDRPDLGESYFEIQSAELYLNWIELVVVGFYLFRAFLHLYRAEWDYFLTYWHLVGSFSTLYFVPMASKVKKSIEHFSHWASLNVCPCVWQILAKTVHEHDPFASWTCQQCGTENSAPSRAETVEVGENDICSKCEAKRVIPSFSESISYEHIAGDTKGGETRVSKNAYSLGLCCVPVSLIPLLIITVAVNVALILAFCTVGCIAVLVKLSQVSYVVSLEPEEWNFTDYITFFGFVNNIRALMDAQHSDPFDFLRLVKAGQDGVLDGKELDEFIHLRNDVFRSAVSSSRDGYGSTWVAFFWMLTFNQAHARTIFFRQTEHEELLDSDSGRIDFSMCPVLAKFPCCHCCGPDCKKPVNELLSDDARHKA